MTTAVLASTPDREADRRHRAERLELLLALAVLGEEPAPEKAGLATCMGLGPQPSRAEHTEIMVLQCHPYASVQLGPEGMLGGPAFDRVAGAWRSLGLPPPGEADHLTALLGLYVRVGQAEAVASSAGRTAVERARLTLLWEHLLSWVPPFLSAVEAAGSAWYRSWAVLMARVLAEEAASGGTPAPLPLSLRTAPDPVGLNSSPHDVVTALVAPVRSGIVLTRADVLGIAGRLGLGVRQGERRFMLRSLLSQDPAGALSALAAEAGARADGYLAWPDGLAGIAEWWAGRALITGQVLSSLAADVSRLGRR